jgi:hypothetical protein
VRWSSLVGACALLGCAGNEPGGACEEGVGNGNQVISGPHGPNPEASDFDSVFRALTVHPADADLVLIGTEANGLLEVSYAAGAYTVTRRRMGIRTLSGEAYPEIYDIAISDAAPNVIAIATTAGPMPVGQKNAHGGLYVSVDGGATFTRRNCGLTSLALTSVSFLPGSSTAMIAAVATARSTNGSLAGTYFPGGIFLSQDQGLTWTSVPDTHGPLEGKEQINDLLVRGTGPSFLVWGVAHDYERPDLSLGALLSLDSGASFSPAPDNAALSGIAVQNASASSDGAALFIVTNSGVVHRTLDRGQSFDTLTGPHWGNTSVAVSPADPDIVLTGGAGPAAHIYRSTNATSASPTSEDVFTTASTEPYGHVDAFAFSGASPNVVYAATKGYLLYRSDDRGATWTLPENGDLRAFIEANP